MAFRVDLCTRTWPGGPTGGRHLPGFPMWVDADRDSFNLTVEAKRAAVAGVLWFLDHAKDGHTLAGHRYDVDVVCAQLTAMGWSHPATGDPVQPPALSDVQASVNAIVDNMTPGGRRGWKQDGIVSKTARAFAHDALILDSQVNVTVG